MIRHPLFIVGMPRSGTTLLSSMLDAHSNIAISPETHFYSRCLSFLKGGGDTVQEIWSCLQQQPGVKDMVLTEEELCKIEKQISDQQVPAPPDVLRALERIYAARFNAEAWGEKTPDHLAHVPAILRDFPDAVVLAITRDPRDVCLSLRDMPWNRSSLPESAWKWRRYAEATERYQTEYGEQFREVRYEDVLDNPRAILREVLAWLGASYEEEMLTFHEQEVGPVDIEREPWKEKARRPIDPSNKEKWRDQMSVGGRVIVEGITTPLMESKGYQRSEKHFGIHGLISVARELGVSIGVILQRLWRQWRMPPRNAGDYTPVWMRQETAFSDQED